MAKLNINGGSAPVRGTRIADMTAGEFFQFEASTKGNNGPCLRVQDSKKGKGRFVNLSTGKLLRAVGAERGTPVEGYLDFEAAN